MPGRPAHDDWLLPTLEALVAPEVFAQLKAAAPSSYWETAVRDGLVTDQELLAALGARLRMKIADLSNAQPQARELVPEALARRYRIIPLAISDSTLDIATSDPNDLDCERTLAFATGRTVRMWLASPPRIHERLEELYRPVGVVEKILENVGGKYDVQSIDEGEELESLGIEGASERPIIRLVDHIIAEGIHSRASDVHLEAEEGGVAVRYRIDGVLRQVMSLPRAVGIPLVSRIKIMSGLDIADRLRPQDGRARVAIDGARIDLRVSTLPAAHGEKVVIRVLDNRGKSMNVDSIGLGDEELRRVNELLATREGIVLVTGPTGSGKTTTLYSMLKAVQSRGGVNIVTVEDPVEYRLAGVVQVQVNEKAGLTFATALRSILRQDPDVVLVGEVRDRETASIAVQASLTGHLVFSTLHTNDAASSVTRLVDIGVESYKIAAALKGIIAQRLLRRVCPQCKEPSNESIPGKLRKWVPDGTPLVRAVGCDYCSQTGYRGRFAIVEILTMGPELERRIAAGETADRLVQPARDAGMRSLFESGLAHVLMGESTLDELMRVVEPPQERRVEPPSRPIARPEPRSAELHRDSPTSSRQPASGNGGGPSGGTVTRRPSRPSTPIVFDEAFQLVDDTLETDTPAIGGGDRAVRQTVLLVEDEDNLRRLLRELLEREGFRVVEAADGVSALDEVDRSAPDIMVLDLDLPRLDGYGVLRYLRTKPATSALPVLVLTAKGDEDSEVRVFESGATDYISKPLRARALSARLRTLLKRTT